MQHLKLIISNKAVSDLHDIWEYISKESPDIADKFINKLYKCCKGLSSFPEQGILRDELLPNIRSITSGRYIIFYLVNEKTLQIIRILNGFRDIDSLF